MKNVLACLFILGSVFAKDLEVVSNGETFNVKAHTLEEALQIPVIYEARTDLDKFPWFRSLLFNLNGYGVTLPESEWAKYSSFPWTDKFRQQFRKYEERRQKAIADQPETYVNFHYELKRYVECEVGDRKYLFFKLKSVSDDKSSSSSRGTSLTWVDGRWKFGPSKNGRVLIEQLDDCYKAAFPEDKL